MSALMATAESQYALMVTLYAGAVGFLAIVCLLAWAFALILNRK